MGAGSLESLIRHTGYVRNACIHSLVRIRRAEQFMLLQGVAACRYVMTVRNVIATWNERIRRCSHSLMFVKPIP